MLFAALNAQALWSQVDTDWLPIFLAIIKWTKSFLKCHYCYSQLRYTHKIWLTVTTL